MQNKNRVKNKAKREDAVAKNQNVSRCIANALGMVKFAIIADAMIARIRKETKKKD
mgnify:CR=1 FL=1